MKRNKPSLQDMILAGLRLAITDGYENITRDQIAEELGCAPSLIPYKMGSMADLRRHIIAYAIALDCKPVVAQGLVRLHPLCMELSKERKQEALKPFGL